MLAPLDYVPEFVKLLELDHVPNLSERGIDDSRFVDRGGCWDAGSHNGISDVSCLGLWRHFMGALELLGEDELEGEMLLVR